MPASLYHIHNLGPPAHSDLGQLADGGWRTAGGLATAQLLEVVKVTEWEWVLCASQATNLDDVWHLISSLFSLRSLFPRDLVAFIRDFVYFSHSSVELLFIFSHEFPAVSFLVVARQQPQKCSPLPIKFFLLWLFRFRIPSFPRSPKNSLRAAPRSSCFWCFLSTKCQFRVI